MPPARIADLRMNVDGEKQILDVSWTAPGDDFDTGSVSGYQFVFSEDITDLLDAERQPSILHKILDRKDSAGTAQSYSFNFRNRYDKDFHIAMYAVDEMGNRGNFSNIVLVRMPAPPPAPAGPNGEPVNVETAETNWVMIGIIVGIIVCIILFLLVGLYIYFFLLRRKLNQRRTTPTKSKSSGVNVDLHHTSGSDASSYESDPKNSSSNQLVPQISTISNVYKQQTNTNNTNGGVVPPVVNGTANPNGNSESFGNGITPTYWSASQLLKEHEERKKRESYAREHQLGPLPEESPAVIGDSNGQFNNGYHASNGDVYGQNNMPQYGYYNGGMESTYPQPNEIYNGYPGYPNGQHQRLSTADSTGGGGVGNGNGYPPNQYYHPIPENNHFNVTLEGSSDTDSTIIRNNNNRGSQINNKLNSTGSTTMPKHSGSDHSSSGTLGLANPSLQGSLLSLNSGRPASTQSKTRNITQV